MKQAWTIVGFSFINRGVPTILYVCIIFKKYSDDSAVVRCISDGQQDQYRELVDHFAAWCGNNKLIFNSNKTKEMIMYFMRHMNKPNNVSIMGEEVEEYSYL